MGERIKWRLSPSKIASLRGACRLFEEDQNIGEQYKAAGEDAHTFCEHMDRPLTGVSPELRELIERARDWSNEFEENYGPFKVKQYETLIKATALHPSGKIDRLYVTEDDHMIVVDFKFGTQPVDPVEINPQIMEYLYQAKNQLNLPIKKYSGVIVQPYLDVIDMAEIEESEIDKIGEEVRRLNEEIEYPFNQPEPGYLCSRCRWAKDCPAVTSAVQRFVNKAALLPMPDQFEPGNLTSDKDRLIALDLAAILIRWAELVKKACREYAEANGNTIAGVWNLTSRGNGYDVTDTVGFLQQLVTEGVLSSIEEGAQYLKVSKARIVDGVSELGTLPKTEIAEIVNAAVQQHGEPKPPITVFRKGGKKQVTQALKDMDLSDLPMIALPSWMEKEK